MKKSVTNGIQDPERSLYVPLRPTDQIDDELSVIGKLSDEEVRELKKTFFKLLGLMSRTGLVELYPISDELICDEHFHVPFSLQVNGHPSEWSSDSDDLQEVDEEEVSV